MCVCVLQKLRRPPNSFGPGSAGTAELASHTQARPPLPSADQEQPASPSQPSPRTSTSPESPVLRQAPSQPEVALGGGGGSAPGAEAACTAQLHEVQAPRRGGLKARAPAPRPRARTGRRRARRRPRHPRSGRGPCALAQFRLRPDSHPTPRQVQSTRGAKTAPSPDGASPERNRRSGAAALGYI